MFKNEFIRLWASRTGLTIKDAKEIWSEFEKIIEECIDKREPLDLRGFGHLDYVALPARIGFDILENKKVEYPEAEKLCFRLSRNLKDRLISDPTKRKIYQTRQAELRRAGLLEGIEYDENEIEETEEDEIDEEV